MTSENNEVWKIVFAAAVTAVVAVIFLGLLPLSQTGELSNYLPLKGDFWNPTQPVLSIGVSLLIGGLVVWGTFMFYESSQGKEAATRTMGIALIALTIFWAIVTVVVYIAIPSIDIISCMMGCDMGFRGYVRFAMYLALPELLLIWFGLLATIYTVDEAVSHWVFLGSAVVSSVLIPIATVVLAWPGALLWSGVVLPIALALLVIQFVFTGNWGGLAVMAFILLMILGAGSSGAGQAVAKSGADIIMIIFRRK